MSFPTFKFKELVEEEWEDSTFGNYLRETRFLFVVYRPINGASTAHSNSSERHPFSTYMEHQLDSSSHTKFKQQAILI